MRKRLPGWLLGAAVGVLFGGIWAMDAVADAQAATLLVDVELDGSPASATVRVHAEDGSLVAEGTAHEAMRLPAGQYSVHVACPAAHAARVLDSVELVARSSVRRVVRFAAHP